MKTTVGESAQYLIRLQRQRKNVDSQIEAIKAVLLPYVKITPFTTPDGSVIYVNGSKSKYFDKERLKAVLIQYLKISPSMAQRILEIGAAEKIINPYVKVLT